MDKNFLHSKTFWAGIIELVIGILLYVQGQLTAGGALSLFAILQIVLRFVTDGKIVLGKTKVAAQKE